MNQQSTSFIYFISMSFTHFLYLFNNTRSAEVFMTKSAKKMTFLINIFWGGKY